MRKAVIFLVIIGLIGFGVSVSKQINVNPKYSVGQKIDSLNGVAVYYNGGVATVNGRTLSKDGYNIGLKYQCVEFVKRYYYQALNHKMPNSYGHAKDFFNHNLTDGAVNTQRNLNQFTNPSSAKPKINDLVVYSGTLLNKYGHVSIISAVYKNKVEIIQQNPGPFGKSRAQYDLVFNNDTWQIKNNQILGWLRQ